MLTCSDLHETFTRWASYTFSTTPHHGTVFGRCLSHLLHCGFSSSCVEPFMFVLFSPFVIVFHDKGHVFVIVEMLHYDQPKNALWISWPKQELNSYRLINMFNHNGMLAAAFKRADIGTTRGNDGFAHFMQKSLRYEGMQGEWRYSSTYYPRRLIEGSGQFRAPCATPYLSHVQSFLSGKCPNVSTTCLGCRFSLVVARGFQTTILHLSLQC